MPGELSVRRIEVGELSVNVAVAGTGPAVLLLHGFPHTWQVWMPVIAELALTHTVVAPDLRGLGATTRAAGGYDVATIADDALGLLDALGIGDDVDVVGLDLGTPAAFMVAMTAAHRVRRLVLMEALVGNLPGAEQFLRDGAPWWFGFHAVPDLAERVLVGQEAAYLDFFLSSGTLGHGVDPAFREAVIEAYAGTSSLHCAFEHYRAFPTSAEQIAAATARRRLTVPTMTVGAASVGNATHAQVQPIADDLTAHVIEDCGHIVPQHRPAALLALLTPFLV